MTVRIVSRLLLLLVALAATATLIIGALSLLASTTPADAAPLLERNQAATAVERAVEAPAEKAPDTSATPVVALVFAGIVLMAALPPIHRVHVYHRPYHRSDYWP